MREKGRSSVQGFVEREVQERVAFYRNRRLISGTGGRRELEKKMKVICRSDREGVWKRGKRELRGKRAKVG